MTSNDGSNHNLDPFRYLRDVHLDSVPLAVEEEVHMELRVAAGPDPLVDEDAHVLAWMVNGDVLVGSFVVVVMKNDIDECADERAYR